MAGIIGNRMVTNGLVLFLDANNPNSFNLGNPTKWNDISFNRYSGDLVSGPTFSPTNGGFITFDGINDNLIISGTSNYNANNGLTYSIWLKQPVNSTGFKEIFAHTNGLAGNNGWRIQKINDTLEFTIGGLADYPFSYVFSHTNLVNCLYFETFD